MKARILCLHGYSQHAAKLRVQSGALRKGLKSVSREFVFVDAPISLAGDGGVAASTTPVSDGGPSAPAVEPGSLAGAPRGDASASAASSGGGGKVLSAGGPMRAWFLANADPEGEAALAAEATEGAEAADGAAGGAGADGSDATPADSDRPGVQKAPKVYICDGLWDSLAMLCKYCEEHGPFDGILGFSQGAAMAAMLLALGKEGALDRSPLAGREGVTAPSLRFGLLFAGFIPATRDADVHALLDADDPVPTPTLHVMGSTDDIISNARSDALVRAFRDAKVVTHSGGHYLCTTSEVRAQLKPFIAEVMGRA